MEIINKALALVMLPLSILIILQITGFYSINLFFDKLIVGSILMIVLQALSLLFIKTHQNEFKIINIVTIIIFSLPGILYLLSHFLFQIPGEQFLPIIVGVMMLGEALYALH